MSNSANDKIINTLLGVFKNISEESSFSNGVDSLQKLINECIGNEKNMNFILQQIQNHLLNLKKLSKKQVIEIIPYLIKQYPKKLYPYIDKIINLFQTSISEETSKILPFISKTFGEISKILIPPDSNPTSSEVNLVYNQLKHFCINNIKSLNKFYQICGTLCLTAFIESCALNYTNADNLKFIWEILIYHTNNVHFHAKLELLNCLISLIFSSEERFRPYASMTLYKIFDYLTDEDWLKRKLSLNIVYTLVYYCGEEIKPLKGYISKFLAERSSDKNEEVKEVCLQIIKLLGESSSIGSPHYDSGFFSDRSSYSNHSSKGSQKKISFHKNNSNSSTKKTSSAIIGNKEKKNLFDNYHTYSAKKNENSLRNYRTVTNSLLNLGDNHSNKRTIDTIKESIENRARTPSVSKKKEYLTERCSSAMGRRKNYNLLNKSGNKNSSAKDIPNIERTSSQPKPKNIYINTSSNSGIDSFAKRIEIIKKKTTSNSKKKNKINKSLNVSTKKKISAENFNTISAASTNLKVNLKNETKPNNETIPPKIDSSLFTKPETPSVSEEIFNKYKEETSSTITLLQSKITSLETELEKMNKKSKIKEEIKKSIKMKNYENAFKLSIEINSINKVSSIIKHFIINCSGEDNNIIFSYDILKSILSFITAELYSIENLSMVVLFIKEKIVDKKIRFDSTGFNKEVYNVFNKLLLKKDRLLLSKKEIDNITSIVKYFSYNDK